MALLVTKPPIAAATPRWSLVRLGVAALAMAAMAAGAGPVAARNGASCNLAEAHRIEVAFTEAERRTEAALAFLDAAPAHAHVHAWFGNAPRGLVRAKIEATLSRLRPGQRPPWKCMEVQACGGARIYAIAWLDSGGIGFCGLFFKASPAAGADSMRGVVVHEVSHIAAGTDDIAYGPAAARTLARRNPKAAAGNADNIEYFIEFLPDARPAAKSARSRKAAQGR